MFYNTSIYCIIQKAEKDGAVVNRYHAFKIISRIKWMKEVARFKKIFLKNRWKSSKPTNTP